MDEEEYYKHQALKYKTKYHYLKQQQGGFFAPGKSVVTSGNRYVNVPQSTITTNQPANTSRQTTSTNQSANVSSGKSKKCTTCKCEAKQGAGTQSVNHSNQTPEECADKGSKCVCYM